MTRETSRVCSVFRVNGENDGWVENLYPEINCVAGRIVGMHIYTNYQRIALWRARISIIGPEKVKQVNRLIK